MRFGLSTGNFRTLCAHAGRARRYLVYEVDEAGTLSALAPLQLAPGMTVHDFHGRGPHPLDDLDVVLTNGCGRGYIARMRARGVRVLLTPERDPEAAIRAVLEGRLTEETMGEQGIMSCHGEAQHAGGGVGSP
ncbi:NifB/NifX family molybdenum-iron cluster-binding protein [Pararhodospirillum photometricum]|nr:NifB/NifX family molybdenum-iron cluster-binding protein [Pararhodospirillum photometricum]